VIRPHPLFLPFLFLIAIDYSPISGAGGGERVVMLGGWGGGGTIIIIRRRRGLSVVTLKQSSMQIAFLLHPPCLLG